MMKMQTPDVMTIDTVEDYAALFGCPSVRHPLFSICRLSDVKDYVPIGKPVRLNLYTVAIKDGVACNARYGWRTYDFSSGTMSNLFLAFAGFQFFARVKIGSPQFFPSGGKQALEHSFHRFAFLQTIRFVLSILFVSLRHENNIKNRP